MGERRQFLAAGIHQTPVPEHGVVHLIVGEELEVALGVELEHAVDVLDALERLRVPLRLGGEQVDNLEGGSETALDRKRGVQEEILRLGLNLEHHQVLHGDEFHLLAVPLPDGAHLLEDQFDNNKSLDNYVHRISFLLLLYFQLDQPQ